MPSGNEAAPDLVIAGAARSGTSFLAARLGEHPDVDPGAVKEPNYFSRELDRGPDWYDGLFAPRRDGLLRLDASASYTYPHYPTALSRLAEAAPQVRVVYAVRDPISRAMSHYWLYHTYFRIEQAASFGAALVANPIFAGTSDYAMWLARIDALFPPEHVLVVPFAALTSTNDVAVEAICRLLLDLEPPPAAEDVTQAHQNQVVTFRSDLLRRTSQALRGSRYYPMVRERVGAQRLRRLRRLVTREVERPTTQEMLATCTAEQREDLHALAARAEAAVVERLSDQDERSGLSLRSYWTERPAGGAEEL